MNQLNQAYQFFIDEAPELLQEIEEGLITLQQDSSTNKVHRIMRAAHSLKGSAATVGLQTIKNIAHKLEDYLKALYNDDLVIDTELESLFLEGYDCLAQPLRQQMETGSFDAETAETKANAVWEKLAAKLGNALQAVQNYIPSSQDLGIDIAFSIFEVDVAQEIRRLKGVVASPDSFDTQAEFTESLDILAGFGELFDLPGFNLIVSIAQQALQKHPHQAVAIAKLLIKDLEKSREQVLNGDQAKPATFSDRSSGGAPSAALLTLAADTHPEIEAEIIAELSQPETIDLDLDDPSYQFFMAEVPDLLQLMESKLLSIKEDKNIVIINEIIRAAHSLKVGSARFGLNGIKDISHKLEDYIKALFDENVVVDDELESLFLEAFDCLKNALSEQIETGSYGQNWEQQAELVWQKLEQKLGNVDMGNNLPSSPNFEDLVNNLENLAPESEINESAPLTPESEEYIPSFEDLIDNWQEEGEESIKGNNEEIELNSSNKEELPHLGFLVDELASFELEENADQGIVASEVAENEAISPESNQQTELQRQSYQFFIEEAVDLIALIDEGLEPVFANRNINEINEVARAAHSLKGGARSAGLEDLGNIALRVEKSLKALFNESIILDEELKTYLRELYQLLREPLTARINNQLIDEKPLLDQANAMWAEFEAKYGEEITKATEILPFSSDLGIDIATSIFEVDVAEGINTIKASLESGNEAELQDTITMQMEIFTGFGEMLALPGFIEICQTGTEALTANPQQLREIAQTLISDLELAQEQVLNGDRTSGGTPSPELLALAGKTTSESETPAPELEYETYTEAPIDTSDQAYSFFVEEAPELLNMIETGLLTLREERETAKIHEIMRAAHSIKGGAASVGLEAIKTIAHKLEDIFKALYDETIIIDTELETWLLEGFDCLRNPLMAQIETGSYQPADALSSANDVWTKIEGKLGDALQRADNYIPSSSDLGVDMVQSMFEVDVAEELDRLKNVVNHPEDKPIAGELRATLEVFTGFGEMLNLPGFAEISQQGLSAVNQNPEKALEITQIIIRDAENARDLVLKGDRTRGGKPSAELLAFTQEKESEEIILPEELNEDIFFIDEDDDETNQDSPSLSEVFGNVVTTSEQIFTPSEEEEETGEIESASINEVFGVELDEEKIAEIYQEIEKEDQISDIPELEEIFASEFSTEEINLLAKSSQIALEDDKNTTLPSIDEVFSTPDFTALEPDEIISKATDSETNPSLEDVFGDKELTFTSIEESAQQELDSIDTIPGLEEVFGDSPPQFQPESLTHQITDSEPKSPTVETEELVENRQSLAENQEQLTPPITPERETVAPITSEANVNIETKTTAKQQQPPEVQPVKSAEKSETASGVTPVSKQTITSIPSTPVEPELPAPANLEQAIKSINDVYQNLPGLSKESDIKVNPRKPQIRQTLKSQDKSSTTVAKSNLTVRVDLERLERMNNLIGELSINRNGLSLQNERLQQSVKELLDRFANFQQMAHNLRDLSDKMLITPDKYRARSANTSNSFPLNISEDGEVNISSAFDSLEMDRYDNMYYVVQDLIEQMIQLEESVDDIALYAKASGQTVEDQRQMLNRMRDELMWARMLPLGEVLNRFPRVLRDLSVKYHKKVNLKLNGTNVLVDKAALEKLYDPLLHLIRNSFDHGIETPQMRKKRGKSETGQIEVRAYHQGNQTIIEVRDDGGGLDLNKIGQKAVNRNLLTPEQLAVATKNNLFDLIFEPGFSTTSTVTEISGRGVGLDIVRSQLRSLKGTISVDSEPNVGTTFTMKLPLTLSIDKLLVLSTDSHFYALPSDNIEEIIVPEAPQLKTSGNKRFLHFENKVIPIYPLNDLLEYRCYLADHSSTTQALDVLPTPEDWNSPLLLIRQGQELFAIEVDTLVSEQELVIKPFGSALTAPSYTYGCTILGDGTLIPVINTAILLENFFAATQPGASLNLTAITESGRQSLIAESGELRSITESGRQSLIARNQGTDWDKTTGVFQVSTILVVDDSAAMRRTLALSLEKAGYRVMQAKDGKEALDQLQQSSNISLVICDIEMPNMNGFEFLGQRRRYPELTNIPVAMLTSRSNEKHQKLATHLGANAYFTKPYIEQKFLQAIKKLVEQSSPIIV